MGAEDKQALVAALAQSHGDQLRRFLATRVRNAADIPDIVQEVFLRLLRVPNHETIRAPEAYIFTIAHHAAQQHTLRQATQSRSVELSDVLPESRTAADVDPALEVSAQQCLEELNRALEGMSPKVQATFLFHRRDGLSMEEIGERLGISRLMAKKYMVKALFQFRQRLKDTE